jgi:hypothetical protein
MQTENLVLNLSLKIKGDLIPEAAADDHRFRDGMTALSLNLFYRSPRVSMKLFAQSLA